MRKVFHNVCLSSEHSEQIFTKPVISVVDSWTKIKIVPIHSSVAASMYELCFRSRIDHGVMG